MRKTLALVSSLLVASSLAVVPASAQQVRQDRTCPSMQFVVVRASAEARTQDTSDSGFLGSIVGPVVKAANDGLDADPSAGFEAAPPASFGQAVEQGNTDASNGGGSEWKKRFNSIGWNKKWQSDTPSNDNSGVKKDYKDKAEVGRTYVNIATNRSGAFIPGVHSETEPTWKEVINGGVLQTHETLEKIHELCPNTKVGLVGEEDGAAVVSEVARDIGNGGGSFPASLITGVATFADPSREDSAPVVADGTSAPAAAPGTSGSNVNKLASLSDVPATEGGGIAVAAEATGPKRGFGSLSDRTVSFCQNGDARCGVKAEAPLTRLISATSKKVNFLDDPLGSLSHVANTLAPAALLGAVETVADAVDFGPRGFSVKTAKNADSTLIGRIVANTERNVNDREFATRLQAAGMKLGGMALNVATTTLQRSFTPANIAIVTSAFQAAGPQAALVAAGGLFVTSLISTVMEGFNSETITTAAKRLTQEAEAAGIENTDVVQAAISAATGQQTGRNSYRNQKLGSTGKTAEGYSKDWLMAQAADVIGKEGGKMLNEQLAANNLPQVPPQAFNTQAITSAMKAFIA